MSLAHASERELTPKRLEPQQILKAAAALARYLEKQRDETKIEKPSLLADDDEENKNSKLDVPLWLLLTAKQHLATSHSLQPGKVVVPHPIYSSPQTQICLISADPPKDDEKAYKNLIHDKTFPKDLATKITKVIAFTSLSKKFKSYESRRQLLADYDLFLVDERVARLLPAALGKTFYQSTTKRPIPVSLVGKESGKKQKKTALERLKPKSKSAPTVIGKPADVGADIEKALSTIAIHLSPSPTLSIKVAYAGWPAEWIADNVAVVVERAVTKYVPAKWAGLKSLYLKGPKTAALPIWMADELWEDETAVLNEDQQETGINKKRLTKEERQKKKDAIEQKKLKRVSGSGLDAGDGKKRKRAAAEEEVTPTKKSKKTAALPASVNPKAVKETNASPAAKRKHNENLEEDEEFEAAQNLHKKLKAKKEKMAPTTIATEPATEQPISKKAKGKARATDAADEQPEPANAVPVEAVPEISAKKKGKKAMPVESQPTRARSTRIKSKT